MPKIAIQTINGKAFEYALLHEFLQRLKAVTKVSVVESEPYKTAKRCFETFDEKEQGKYMLVSSFAINSRIWANAPVSAPVGSCNCIT